MMAVNASRVRVRVRVSTLGSRRSKGTASTYSSRVSVPLPVLLLELLSNRFIGKVAIISTNECLKMPTTLPVNKGYECL